jgi:hypothetical protein
MMYVSANEKAVSLNLHRYNAAAAASVRADKEWEARTGFKRWGLYKLNECSSVDPQLETAWFQPFMNLKCDIPVFKIKFAFSNATCTATKRGWAAHVYHVAGLYKL